MADMSLRCFVEDLAVVVRSAKGRAPVISLSEPEARHARLSRRLSVGDPVELMDGQGLTAQGAISAVTKMGVDVAVGLGTAELTPRLHPALTLAVAMPKGPRQDFLIEKCTELGVAAIQPLITERSVAGASDHRRDKWRRATIEAAKQSGQAWLPELFPPITIEQLLATEQSFTVRRYDLLLAAMVPSELSAVPNESASVPLMRITDVMAELSNQSTTVESSSQPTMKTVLACVGPEGGFTEVESQRLLAAGAKSIALGLNVLRIETAALALAAAFHGMAEPRVMRIPFNED